MPVALRLLLSVSVQHILRALAVYSLFPPLSFIIPIMSGSLTPTQLAKYHQDGYLVIPNFFDPTTILQHAKELIHSFDPKGHPMTKFSTGGEEGVKEEEHVGDRYFLESGDKIRYFLEEDSIGSDGKLNRSPDLCVNKCGHALHCLDPIFHQLTFSEKVQNLIKSLDAFSKPQCLQSMVICKQPSIGGAVPPHNDSTFLYTSPPSATGLWFALEDCTTTNGCLSFIPGSHRWQKGTIKPNSETLSRPQNEKEHISHTYGDLRGVNKRFIRSDPNNVDAGTSFEILSEQEEEVWDEDKASIEACKAGTLVLIHGSVMHKSEKNKSDKSRYIYTFHCIEGDSTKAHYDARNWLQPSKGMPFSELYNPPALRT